jgi:outer membrane receptor protein involved in Fe transport
MRHHPWLLVLAACAAAPVIAQAQVRAESPDPADLERLITLLNTPIQVASKREQRVLESPQAVEVLTADQIRASGVFRLVDVLRLLTNVQVFEFGDDLVQISLRGTATHAQRRNVQLLVDGIPIFNTEYSAVDFGLPPIPLDAIEKVEVVRGPSSSLYGANAQVGVVAITTRRAKEGSSMNLRTGAANASTHESQGFYSFGAPGFNFTTGFGARSQGDSGISERVLGGTRLVDPQDQNHSNQVFLRPELVLGEGRVWVLYSVGSHRAGPQVVESPAGVKLYQFAFFGDSLEAAQAGWAQTWSPELRTQWTLNRVRMRYASFARMEVVPGSPTSAGLVPVLQALDPGLNGPYDVLDATTEQLAFQANWDPSPTLHLVMGADAARAKAPKAPLIGLHVDQENSASGVFLAADWTLGAATFSLGARVENDSLGGPRTSPRVAVVYALPEGSALRAGYYTSTRSPQMLELVQDIRIPGRPAPMGNPALVPERYDNYEVGYRKTWASWSLDLTAYQMNLRKVINPEATGLLVAGLPQTQFQNSGSTLHNRGLELTLNGELRPGWLVGFNAATLAFRDETGVQQSFSPRVQANLWARYHLGRFQAFGALQQLGSYRLANQANYAGPSEGAPARLQAQFNLAFDLGSGFQVALYGVNVLRASDETTPGSINNGHLIRFERRELGLQAGYRF